MKPIIFIDPGHSDRDPGAVGFETEFKLAEIVSKHQADYLKTHYECEPYVCPSNIDSLAQVCKLANDMRAALLVSNHFNAGGGDGYECYVHNESRRELGQLFEKHVKAAGQNSRGVKLRPSLYVLKNTNMPAILNEGAFVDNKTDIQDWNDDAELKKMGIAYAKASAEWLELDEKTSKNEWLKDNTGWWYRHADGSYTKNNWEKIDDKWYYFDDNGYMMANTILNIDGKYYALLPDGHMGVTDCSGALK